MKTCTICNTEKSHEEFLKDKHAKGGYRNQCKACLRSRNKESWDKRKTGYNAAMRKFRSTWKGCTQTSLSAAKNRAYKEGLSFNIDLEYLRVLLESQNYVCAMSGEPLVINGGWCTPSLDKKDPVKGYVKGNVQWVTKRVNTMKGNLTPESFLDLCKKCLERSETIRKEYTSSEVEAHSTER